MRRGVSTGEHAHVPIAAAGLACSTITHLGVPGEHSAPRYGETSGYTARSTP